MIMIIFINKYAEQVCGYKKGDLMCALDKALLIGHADVLNNADNVIRSRMKTESHSLTYVIIHDRKGSAGKDVWSTVL